MIFFCLSLIQKGRLSISPFYFLWISKKIITKYLLFSHLNIRIYQYFWVFPKNFPCKNHFLTVQYCYKFKISKFQNFLLSGSLKRISLYKKEPKFHNSCPENCTGKLGKLLRETRKIVQENSENWSGKLGRFNLKHLKLNEKFSGTKIVVLRFMKKVWQTNGRTTYI